MSIFTSKFSERESQLELALQGVLFSEKVEFSYVSQGDEKEKRTKSPVYLLPMDAYNQVIHGFFKINGKLSEAPIGFMRNKAFLLREPYLPCLNGELDKEDRIRDSRIYLPLKLTDMSMGIGKTTDGKFVPGEGSPFPVYGIDGNEGIHPLIFVTESEERLLCKGIYKTKDGTVLPYNHQAMRPSDSEVRELLRQFFRGTGPVQSAVSKELVINAPQLKKDGEKNSRVSIESPEKLDWEEPRSITRYLDQYVIGQEDAKIIVAVAFSNYMVKVRTGNEELPKDNLLLVGPSGVGKTYMISLLAKEASLPMVQTQLTGKSSEGYKGENLSGVFEQIRASTSGEAPYGIVFFDEIDKLARDDWGSGSGFGSRLQNELIGWLEEATVIGSDTKDKNEGASSRLNTRNILFVTAGAFQGPGGEDSLADIINKRLGNEKRQIGFGAPKHNSNEEQDSGYALHKARPEDLIIYGLKPELIGRFPSIGILGPLSVEDRVRILTEAQKSPLKKYFQLLELKGYQLELEEGVPEIIVGYCPQETGARALNAICNDLFTRILYEPDKYANDKGLIKVTPDLTRNLINLYG